MKTVCFLLMIAGMCVLLAGTRELFALEQSVVVEATGEAAGSDLESPREVCERAKSEAQRSAIEQAVGTFVRGHTVVSNSQLADDLTYTQVRGKVEQLTVVSEARKLNSCIVKVKARIAPQYPDRSAAIQIKAALSRAELREGEELGIQYQANRSGYVYIFVVSADGAVTQLLPNSTIRDNKLLPGSMYFFPPTGSGIRLKAALQQGAKKSGADERIKIVVTKQQELLLERGFQEGFAVYDAHSTGLISDLLKRLLQLDPTDWGEATLEYRINP